MGPRAKKAAAAIVGALAIALTGEGCRAPTQVTLDVTYSGPCSDLGGVGLIVGTNPYVAEGRIDDNVFTTLTTQCTDGTPSRVGTLVVTPNEDTDQASIIVVAGFGKRPEACKRKDGYFGCIVSRRTFFFVENSDLTLGIVLDPNCKNVPCDAVSTCKNAQCVDSKVNCSGDNCGDPGVLDDGGVAIVDAPTSSDAYVNQDGPPPPPPVDGGPTDSGKDSGVCDLPSIPLTCQTSVGPSVCSPGDWCAPVVTPPDGGGGDSGDAGGGSISYACKPPGTPGDMTNPAIPCTSAKQCNGGQVCCRFPADGGSMGPSCMSTCVMGGVDSGFQLDQLCEDNCECEHGTCSLGTSIGTNPPQDLLKRCSP